MKGTATRVLLLDGDSAAGAALRQRLAALTDIEVVEAPRRAGQASGLTGQVRGPDPDLVLVDLDGQGGAGLEAARSFDPDRAPPVILAFSAREGETVWQAAAAAGADALLRDVADPDRLGFALRRFAARRRPLPTRET